MRLKVVVLSTFLSPLRSGAEACAEEVSRILSDRYDIVIVSARMRRNSPQREKLWGRVPVVRVGFGFSFDKWLFPFLAPLAARREEPVLIHAILETFAGLALVICRFLCPRAKRLLTLQTTNRAFLKEFVLRSPHAVTAISAELAQRAEDLGRKDVSVIPNGLTLSAIPTMEKVPGRILFVGRLEAMKGVDTLLKAYAALGAFLHERTELVIVGEGSLRPSLEALARELKLQKHVHFLRYVPTPDVYRAFAEAEIFVSCSRHEALGNVFLEAQAARCAVIGTTVEGIPEIVKDGETGLLVPPDDVSATKAALEKLLVDSGLRNRLAQAGKFHAQDYDWSTIAEKYGEEYEELLETQ